MKIIVGQFLRVDFESKVNWKLDTDLLRCSPSFQGQERYDAVIISRQGPQGGSYEFARLHLAFICQIQDQRYALGLIWPMAIISPSTTTARGQNASNVLTDADIDRALSLCRVRARKGPEIVPLRSITRGALLYKDPAKTHDYIAVDVVDSDMFLRLKELFPHRSMA